MSSINLLVVGIGGFIGAISRVLLISFINEHHSMPIPIATMMINIIGSFILGILFAYFYNFQSHILIKSFLSTGLIGAFTTFSTFAVESIFLLHSIKLFIIYVFISTFGSILMAFTGYKGFMYFYNP